MFVFVSPETWTAINVIAGTISALAALATVIVAVWAFQRARQDKRLDDESRHPDFSMHGSISAVEEKNSHIFELVFQNRGENPAADIQAKVVFFSPPYGEKDNQVFVKNIVGTIHKISSFAIHEIVKIEQEGAQQFLIVRLQYRDGRTNKNISQDIYQKCTGFKALNETYFEEISFDERELIDGKAEKLLSS